MSEIFFKRVYKNGPEYKDLGRCWEWTGSKNSDGYGDILTKFRQHRLAHRISFLLHHEDFDSKLMVCHHCDNRICVNPKHLFQGTAKENFDDAISKGRPIHKLAPAPRKVFEGQESDIVTRIKAGESQESIAKDIGVCRELVSRYARKNGIRRNLTEEDKQEILQLSQKGLNNRQIGDLIGREQSTVRKVLARI